MQTSFNPNKADVQLIQQSDNSYLIKYKGKRQGPSKSSNFKHIPKLLGIPIAVGVLGSAIFNSPFPWVLSFIIFVVLIALFEKQNIDNQIQVLPGQGIIFNGNSLPFTQIENIVKMQRHNVQMGVQKWYIAAQVGGTEIPLTNYVSNSAGEAIFNHIKSFYLNTH